MIPFIAIISFLWFVVIIKLILFWIYLWQLKNYHVGRLLDHFKTHQGKKLLLGIFPVITLLLLFLVLVNQVFIYAVLAVYAAESLLFAASMVKKTIRKPVTTIKTTFLVIICVAAAAFYFYITRTQVAAGTWFIIYLLLFDILAPIIISLLVLIFQPFFVMGRNRILKKATQKMATFKNITVIGITGSYGKTSTKEFLTTILASKFRVAFTPDHKNSEIGIAQTILNDVTSYHQIFIVEMGAYNKGKIRLLCDMVKPRIGIVTGVNEQHLSTFGSLENLLSAEGGRELVQCLPKDGTIILNGDNAYCLDLYKKVYSLIGGSLKKKIYTLKKDKIDSDIWTEDIIVYQNSLTFVARSKEGEMTHFNVPILGKHNVQNLLGAILIAKGLGMSFEEISQACQAIDQKQAGITLKTGVFGLHIIDSSYSSNPDGVMADLDYLNVFAHKKTIVMPCLIELGNKSKEIHYQIGKKIAQVCDLAIITTKERFEEIKRGAMENGMQENTILLCDPSASLRAGTPQEIFNHVTTFCKEGDAVLLEGRVPSEVIKLLKL